MRVAPVRTATPQPPRRRWRPRRQLSELVAGVAGFATFVAVVSAPVALLAAGGLSLTLGLALLTPPVITMVGGFVAKQHLSYRTLPALTRAMFTAATLGAAIGVGLAVGGLAWAVGPGAGNVGVAITLQPVLVACAYSLAMACSAALVGARLRSGQPWAVTAA
jgi:phosphate/sulfate permease